MYWTDHDVAPTIIADHGPDGIQRVKPSQATWRQGWFCDMLEDINPVLTRAVYSNINVIATTLKKTM